MKKAKIFVAFILSFSLFVVGCGNDSDEEVTVEDTEITVDEAPEQETTDDEMVDEETEESEANVFDQTQNMDAYYYEVNTVLADGTSFVTKFWSSGNKTKMESNYPETGEQIIMIMDGYEEVTYLYMPAENTALKMELGNLSAFSEDDNPQGTQDYIEIMKEFADDEEVDIESGTLDGEAVRIITGEIEGNMNKIWISEQSGLPLKSEFYMNGELESTATFENFEEKAIDPSIFTLPDDVEIQDMTNY